MFCIQSWFHSSDTDVMINDFIFELMEVNIIGCCSYWSFHDNKFILIHLSETAVNPPEAWLCWMLIGSNPDLTSIIQILQKDPCSSASQCFHFLLHCAAVRDLLFNLQIGDELHPWRHIHMLRMKLRAWTLPWFLVRSECFCHVSDVSLRSIKARDPEILKAADVTAGFNWLLAHSWALETGL